MLFRSVQAAARRVPSCRTTPFTPTLAALGAAILLLQGTAAWGQSQTADDLQRIQRAQQEELRRQQRQFEQDRSSPRPPTSLQPEAAPQPGARPATTCRDIRTIELSGAHLLLASTRDRLVMPYLGRCLNVNDIERLMGAVTAEYVSMGHITARVYLGQQDLSKGHLTLTVVEGVLDKIRVEDGGTGSVSAFNAFPRVVGRPLNLRDIEQGLDQINRLSSNNASMAIEPGAQPGESVLVIKNVPSKPWHASVAVDNFGADLTGPNQLATSLSWDNLLGLNDFISLTDRRSLGHDDNRRNSRANTLTWSVPFGATLVSVGGSASTYLSTLRQPGGFVAAQGETNQVYVRVDQTVYRDRDNLLTLSANVTHKNTDTYVQYQKFEGNSRALSVVDLDLNLRRPLWGGILFAGIGISQGTDWFGALEDPDAIRPYQPRAQFQGKTRVTASWNRYFEAGASTIDIGTQFSGQYSKDTLYGSEQFLIGGIYSVRGFDLDTLSNDTGWYLRNEIGVRTPFQAHGQNGSWRPYLAVDVGSINQRPSADFQGDHGDKGRLVGGALGLQLRWGPASLDTFVMKPLHREAGLNTDRTSVRAVLSVSF